MFWGNDRLEQALDWALAPGAALGLAGLSSPPNGGSRQILETPCDPEPTWDKETPIRQDIDGFRLSGCVFRALAAFRKSLVGTAFPSVDDTPARSRERHASDLALEGRPWQRRLETAR